MPSPKQLQERLAAIAASVAASPHSLALLGLGSAGAESARMDQYSDLDFFVIVEEGSKMRFLNDLGWLEQAAPLAFTLQNTVDGYKLLFADGIFGEMAVFEPQELAAIPYTAARVIWQRPGSDLILPLANNLPGADTAVRTTAWLVDEALTNLYIGLARWQRGERLSAARFIQGHAVDRVLELAARLEPPQSGQADPFAPERRFEQRQPQTAVHLPAFMPGYEHSPQAARAILAFLEQHFALNEALRTAVYNADPLEGQT